MSDHPKINESHRQRQAVIYIRQSTPHQVIHHAESQQLQYQLVQRAHALGWPAEQISVIDDDLGQSAVSRQGRHGFERLFTDIGTGKVGLLLVTDVSRLARNCADWYQLLDLTALNDVLVCDSGGLYSSRAYDDRMLLGIKGAFSEAQWHLMRQQLQAARLNKAKRGELKLRLPVGYERLPNGTVIKTADRQVQQAITMVFTRFKQSGSARAVLRQLRQDGLQLPRRQRNALGQSVINWTPPSYMQVYQILKLPAYAGAYAYGQRQRTRLPGQTAVRYGQRLSPEKWQVLIHDLYPAYISWEQYMDNQETLQQNWQATRFADPQVPAKNLGARQTPHAPQGAAGKGRALLQGIVRCGRCGRRLRVRYRDKPAYVCEALKQQFDTPRCQFFPYAHVDQAVVAAFWEAAQPAAIEAALEALTTLHHQQQALNQQWQHQLDRADHAIAVARARYEQVDPTLRLVAAELEQAWEVALAHKATLTQQWESQQAEQATLSLSSSEVTLVQQLAADLPALWAAETTSMAERKRLLRTLIAEVVLDSVTQPGVTQIAVHWQTGAITHHSANRPRPGHPSDPVLLARIRQLAQAGQADGQIAMTLNEEGVVSSWHVKDDPTYLVSQSVTYWTAQRVGNLRRKHAIPRAILVDGLLSASETAERLGVSFSVVLDWFRRGLLPGRQLAKGKPVRLRLDDPDFDRFRGQPLADLPDALQAQLRPLEVALSELGLSPQQLREAVNNGRLNSWRLKNGRRFRWYLQIIHPDSAHPADSQPL